MTVKFFDEDIKQFIRELTMPTSAKIFRTLELLERFGHRLSMPHSKHITRRLLELRVRGVQEVRLIYTFQKGMAVILHGFFKKSDKISRKEIDLAYQKLFTLDRI